MEDKILDDDDIIDLTDLLEEGQPPEDKETPAGSGQSPDRVNEPDSFDLGKEISMEYDVSVDEIEHGDDNFDIDVSLSSNEEEALTDEKIPEDDVIQLEDTGESLEGALDEDESLEGIDLSVDEQDVLSPDAKEDTFSVSQQDLEVEASASEPDIPASKEVSIDQGAVAEAEEGTFDMEEALTQEPEEIVITEKAEEFQDKTEEVPVKAESEEELPQINSDEVMRELSQEIPNMLEGVVRPLMGELVREIISVSREQLPGIVEKVIREEIDKLKKLDS